MKLYLAGPLFTTAERDFNRRLGNSFSAFGHSFWLPQEHEPREKTVGAVFRNDVEGIDWADAVIANMDGPDPDSGTAWECGYAYANKKIVGLYRTDFRKATDMGGAMVNLMLVGSANFSLDMPNATTTEIAESVGMKLKEWRIATLLGQSE